MEALAGHAAHADRIARVIVDMVMPRLNGRQTDEELRRGAPALPVLFATGYSLHHLADGLIDPEQVRRKPFTACELRTRLRAVLAAAP